MFRLPLSRKIFRPEREFFVHSIFLPLHKFSTFPFLVSTEPSKDGSFSLYGAYCSRALLRGSVSTLAEELFPAARKQVGGPFCQSVLISYFVFLFPRIHDDHSFTPIVLLFLFQYPNLGVILTHIWIRSTHAFASALYSLVLTRFS